MTQRVGLKPNEDEYILMGMAAYGDQREHYHHMRETFFELGPHDHWTFPDVKFKHNLHRGCKWYREGYNKWTDKLNIAAATQSLYEDIFIGIVEHCFNKYKSKNLVVMGGCALNCLANSLASRCIAARFIVCGCDADMLNGVTSSASEDGAWTTRVWSSSVLLPCSSLKAEVMSSVRSSRLICPPT